MFQIYCLKTSHYKSQQNYQVVRFVECNKEFKLETIQIPFGEILCFCVWVVLEALDHSTHSKNVLKQEVCYKKGTSENVYSSFFVEFLKWRTHQHGRSVMKESLHRSYQSNSFGVDSLLLCTPTLVWCYLFSTLYKCWSGAQQP